MSQSICFKMTNCIYIMLVFYYTAYNVHPCYGKQVAVKIVEEPTNYGFNAGGYQNEVATSTLHLRVPPSNFSGPEHLRRLQGLCFNNIIESYKYELCPFSNITQHEQSLRWNPYSGVLGVWQEWDIENNTFVAMVMSEGDSCGSLHRTTRVLFHCAEDNVVMSVTEPKTCNYELVFGTPFVCHPQSLLVYPTLPQLLQREWDLVEGRLLAEEITQQGYKKLLQKIFEKAGYRIPLTMKQKLADEAKQKETRESETKTQTFDTLYQCQSEYNKLKEEVESLKTALRVNGIQHDTIDNHEKDRDLGDLPHDYNHMDYEWMHDKGDY